MILSVMTDISVFKMSQKAYTDKYEDVIYKTVCEISFWETLILMVIKISNVMQSNQQDICI